MKRARSGLAAAMAVTLAGCAGMGMDSSGAKATATLSPKSGTSTGGTVTFQQQSGGVMMTASVTGLPPNSTHGFHVHEKGDCSAPDAMSAGGHFNPAGKPHGQIDMPDHHAGDMNNLVADASGNAKASYLLPGVTLDSGPNSLIGRAVVVHKDPDDYKTQPTGNSGARVACGVVAAS